MKPALLDRLISGRVLNAAVAIADDLAQQLQETFASFLVSAVQFATLAATRMVLEAERGISARFQINGEATDPRPLSAGGLLFPAS